MGIRTSRRLSLSKEKPKPGAATTAALMRSSGAGLRHAATSSPWGPMRRQTKKSGWAAQCWLIASASDRPPASVTTVKPPAENPKAPMRSAAMFAAPSQSCVM
ncbi:hypothetical protein D9M72_588330 [compost metagenome]